jgi:hypothetical protein
VGYLHLPRGDTPVKEDLAEWDESVLESAYEAARGLIRDLRRDGGVHFRPGESGRGIQGDLGAFLGQGFLETAEDGGDL